MLLSKKSQILKSCLSLIYSHSYMKRLSSTYHAPSSKTGLRYECKAINPTDCNHFICTHYGHFCSQLDNVRDRSQNVTIKMTVIFTTGIGLLGVHSHNLYQPEPSCIISLVINTFIFWSYNACPPRKYLDNKAMTGDVFDWKWLFL